ncbi:MAG: hypothetical protein M3179_11570 [Actinomycetota bacterium]|nr:hypothetical protein [Actinomycetota bacterium]
MGNTPARRALVPTALAVSILAGGCMAPIRNEAAPRCNKTDTLVLMAQSVPSAELVPCLGPIPAGWTFGDMDIGSGDSAFSLDSTDAGISAVMVTLAPTCDRAGATEVASDEAGTQQFERIESLVGQYRGTRSYVFGGGCVTYRFRFPAQNTPLVNDVSLALTFRTRADIDEAVRRMSGGRLHL